MSDYIDILAWESLPIAYLDHLQVRPNLYSKDWQDEPRNYKYSEG
jgi:hypothetical protein